MAIMTWIDYKGALTQASYNNNANANLADVGTDIITVALPISGMPIPCDTWVGNLNASNSWWKFLAGCPDGDLNVQLFKEATGYDSATGMSPPLVLVDSHGNSTLFQITNYLEGENVGNSCDDEVFMHVTANSGLSDGINPPGAPPGIDTTDLTIKAGVKFRAFRVRDGWLEQKDGIFNPNTDNPGNDFVPLLPNVEDLQIAWLYNDGTVWNSAAQQLPVGVYPGVIPSQATGNPYDVENVMGLRMTVTARSSTEIYWEDGNRFRRPAAEDHTASGVTDRFYHESVTELAMIRNRNLQQ
jgi:hypothetical protein